MEAASGPAPAGARPAVKRVGARCRSREQVAWGEAPRRLSFPGRASGAVAGAGGRGNEKTPQAGAGGVV